MAKSLRAKDARRLITEHRDLRTKLTAACKTEQEYTDAITKSCNVLINQAAQKLLKDIPIEELNRDKQGIRVKLLREHGYETIADISNASLRTLAGISGIGADSATAIRQEIDEIIETTRKAAKIRLSTDDRSPQATALVFAIAKYRNAKPHIAACRNLLSADGKQIDTALQDLTPAANGLKWLFTSASKKQKATAAYDTLSEYLAGDYGKTASNALAGLKSVIRITNADAWRDFSENSVAFFNILEKIVPDALGSDKTVYGLPEDLAQGVAQETFFAEGLNCELRGYQAWGVKYALHQKRVLLGDEMGLGKTIQAIAVMVSLRNSGATHFLVVCPASVITNWCREIKKMSTLTPIKIHGSDRDAALSKWLESGGVAVTTYETTGLFSLAEDFQFSLLVVDEAHYIKNPEARRTIHVKSISAHAERLLFMTGTALENKADEMIALIRILQPEIASQVSSMAYLSAAEQFREKVAPVYYRRKREDVLTELPELIENREWCDLLEEEEKVYEQAVLAKRYADARRVSWNVDDLSKSSKAQRLLEIVEKAEDDGRKVIVFSFFLDTIRKITELLGDKCMSPINGSVTPRRRQEIIDEFNQAPAGSVLAAQIQSGGTGLNIQSASVVILCEPQFKPSIENQAISRAYRMGQTRNVLVYRLLCDDTVDEKIMDILESKQEIFDAFADDSTAADETAELDDTTFGKIMQEEAERINAKNATAQPQTQSAT